VRQPVTALRTLSRIHVCHNRPTGGCRSNIPRCPGVYVEFSPRMKVAPCCAAALPINVNR